MWIHEVLLLFCIFNFTASEDDEEPVLYYYGLEESERSLPNCVARQACSALIRRDWQPPALVRLCACSRRQRCDTPAHAHANDDVVAINNRDYLQFCKPITDWPVCAYNDIPLIVESPYGRMNPDELEDMHHKNIQLTPPKITFKCKCRQPNYWKLYNETHNVKTYKCRSLPLCQTDEFCGNVNYDLNTLYQSCFCPKNHICVHNGGVTYITISELLYEGNGWRAHCLRIKEVSQEDYY